MYLFKIIFYLFIFKFIPCFLFRKRKKEIRKSNLKYVQMADKDGPVKKDFFGAKKKKAFG